MTWPPPSSRFALFHPTWCWWTCICREEEGLRSSGRSAVTRPAVRFLALSVSDSADDVIETIRAGARGYVTKTISTAELVEALATVAAGDAVFSPRLAGFVLDAFGGGAGAVDTSP